MEAEDFIWYGIICTITVAYAFTLGGVRAARRHNITHHSRWMVTACTIVSLWLLGYVTKQVFWGRDLFGGTEEQYWQLYIPLLGIHTFLAIATIGLAIVNLKTGFTRLRHFVGVEATVNGVSRHRQLGKLMVGTFTGTLITAYLVYLMLFHWN